MSTITASADSTLNIERRVERMRQEHTYTRTETLTRRTFIPPEGSAGIDSNMPQYTLDSESTSSAAYGHVSYATNGLHNPHGPPDQPSPSPSPALHQHLATLGSRNKQQVPGVTQLDYATYGRAPSAIRFAPAANYEHIAESQDYRTHSPNEARRYVDPYGRNYADYEPYPHLTRAAGGGDYAYQPGGQQPIYRDYADGRMDNPPPGSVYLDRPQTPPSPSERSESPSAQHAAAAAASRDYMVQGLPYAPTGYAEMESAPPVDRYAQSPYGRSAYANVNGLDSQSQQTLQDYGGGAPPQSPNRRLSQIPLGRGGGDDTYGTRPPPPVPTESMAGLSLALEKGMRWRDPDLHEVIAFLSNPNAVVKANAAAYLQHLCYNSDPIKQQTRLLGGIPPLVALLTHEQPEVQKNACGALRNLSYGRQNDENKRALHKAGGIPSLIKLLQNSPDPDIQELVTGVLWNLSSCEELKRVILEDALTTLVAQVIIPHSGWDKKNPGPTHWTALLRNSSGVLRNVSSAGIEARQTLRKYEGLVEALLYLVRGAIDQNHMDNKSVENVVCILRNLSYRCEEVVNPNYDKQPPASSVQSRANAQPSTGENQGCFGASRKKKDSSTSGAAAGGAQQSPSSPPTAGSSSVQRSEPAKGMELLWQPDVVQPYLALLSNCSNPETLEAAAGAIQNLAACYWQPSIDIRAAVRKEKGLPVLVELLRMEVDRVVCAVATALRNLALDQRNKELIGKYAMRDLVQKLPSTITSSKSQGQQQQHDLSGASDDTIAAVLATLNEVIKKNAEFARSLLDEGGVDRLVGITRSRTRYTGRVVKFASQVLAALWAHQELRDAYKKAGYKESDFVSRSSSSSNSAGSLANSGGGGGAGGGASSPSHSAANSTLNRPMSSQGGTRYEDKTLSLQRGNNANSSAMGNNTQNRQANYRGEEVPLADMQYPEGSTHAPPPGGVRIFPPGTKPGEPVYAQVNRDKKRSRQYDGSNPMDSNAAMMAAAPVYEERRQMDQAAAAGDSWV